MKRFNGLTITLICLGCVFLVALLGFVGIIIHTHLSINSYIPEKTIIQHDTIYLETYVTEVQVDQDERNIVEFVGFEVFSKDTNQSIYKSGAVCRAYDFKGIEFLKNSNDIVVKSGDIGSIHFKQTAENVWERIE